MLSGEEIRDSWLQRYLRGHQVNCPYCGVAIDHAVLERCPGCRGKLLLALSVAEGYRVSWGLLVACTALMANLGFAIAASILTKEWWGHLGSSYRRPSETLAISLLTLGPVLGCIAAGLVWKRRTFMKSSVTWQLLVLTLCGALMLVTLFGLSEVFS